MDAEKELEIFIRRMKIEKAEAELALMKRKLALQKDFMKKLEPPQLPPLIIKLQTARIFLGMMRFAPLSRN
jgi:hypothetical protein